MKCVILAAGEGTRMRPLTNERPKPLVRLLNKPLMEHVIDALPTNIDEMIVVVGYRADQIREYFGQEYKGKKMTYVRQDQLLGTAHALLLAQPYLSDSFLVVPADDIHGADALVRAVQNDLCLLVAISEHPERFGVVSVSQNGTLAGIIEKPDIPETNLVSTGAMVLDPRIFEYKAERKESGEYYLPDMLTKLAQEHMVAIEHQEVWHPLGYPEDIARLEMIL